MFYLQYVIAILHFICNRCFQRRDSSQSLQLLRSVLKTNSLVDSAYLAGTVSTHSQVVFFITPLNRAGLYRPCQ